MITIAADILTSVRSAYLNDPNAGEATDDRLLPHLKEAYKFLQSELEANGVPCKNEEVIETILANKNEYYPLPDDLVVPNTMFERTPGSSEEFRPMTYRMNLPQVTPTPYLQYWTYRLDRIYLVPATQNREIKLYYQKSFPAVETVDDSLYGKAEQFLALKTAALYNFFVRQQPTAAKVCNDLADRELEDIISSQVKSTQSQVIRRKGYIPGATS